LVNDLKSRDLWDKVMVNDLKYFDGSVQTIDRIPADLKAKYATAFEVEPRWLGRQREPPSEVDRSGAVTQLVYQQRQR
jgi:ribonucleotide reductase alpha subunit